MVSIVLEIKNLYVSFNVFEGEAKVINGVNLYIKDGEAVALVGETGCGKTVTAQAVFGILPTPPAIIKKGEILLKGKDVLKMNEDELDMLRRKEISYVPQYPMICLNPVFTIGEQLIDFIKIRASTEFRTFGYLLRSALNLDKKSDEDAAEKAMDLLRKLQMPSPGRVMKAYPFELSGGMRQRVLIAMALIGEPLLLIADEPGSALDVTIQDEILRLFEDQIEKRGLSTLYITHDLAVARQITERVYIMYAGDIVEAGKTSEIFEDPKHPYTSGLMKSIPRLTGVKKLTGIPGRIPDYGNPPSGCRFHPRCNYATEICKRQKPKSVGKEHIVFCHLIDKVI